jgi:hypothetical protein
VVNDFQSQLAFCYGNIIQGLVMGRHYEQYNDPVNFMFYDFKYIFMFFQEFIFFKNFIESTTREVNSFIPSNNTFTPSKDCKPSNVAG